MKKGIVGITVFLLCAFCVELLSTESLAGRRPNPSYGDITPIGPESLIIPDTLRMPLESGRLSRLEACLADDVIGTLSIKDKNLKARIISEKNFGDKKEVVEIELIPQMDGNRCVFYPASPITNGEWMLDIPEGFFEITPDVVEVNDFDADDENFADFSISGAWHLKGEIWKGPAMFSVIDDDCVDRYLSGKVPGDYMHIGFYGILYPILESLGLRGNMSLDGRQVGFTNEVPKLNVNGKVALRLQNERGWEALAHSMDCLGETLNNWVVDSLNTSLAREILAKYPYRGISAGATSVYDRSTGKQYFPLQDNSGWQESPRHLIKPYAGDFTTKKPVLYNPEFDLDYHWGECFRLAREFGFKTNCYACYNSSSSHALIAELNKICPFGFADSTEILYNVPPLKSTAARIGLEGQLIKGYIGEKDTDNTYRKDHFEYFKKKIDKCREEGGWIVLYTHAYRECWKNYIKGSLISEGGDYPDEWVEPMLGTDPVNDSLDPPARLGIKDWSEWYPCPGTRCHMIWELLKYAKNSGMINATCSEGFEKFGNRKESGYFSYGERIGQDVFGIEGTADRYPHFVQGANGEIDYYNPYLNERIEKKLVVVSQTLGDLMMESDYNRPLDVVSPAGTHFKIKKLKDLQKGLWIVNGIKILIP